LGSGRHLGGNMNKYRVKTIYNGQVAIPYSKIESDDCLIRYKDKNMVIKHNTVPSWIKNFKDKFGRGEYTLCYYKWEPQNENQLELF